MLFVITFQCFGQQDIRLSKDYQHKLEKVKVVLHEFSLTYMHVNEMFLFIDEQKDTTRYILGDYCCEKSVLNKNPWGYFMSEDNIKVYLFYYLGTPFIRDSIIGPIKKVDIRICDTPDWEIKITGDKSFINKNFIINPAPEGEKVQFVPPVIVKDTSSW